LSRKIGIRDASVIAPSEKTPIVEARAIIDIRDFQRFEVGAKRSANSYRSVEEIIILMKIAAVLSRR